MKDKTLLQKEKIHCIVDFITTVYTLSIFIIIQLLCIMDTITLGKAEVPPVLIYFMVGFFLLIILSLFTKSKFVSDIWIHIWDAPSTVMKIAIILAICFEIFSISGMGIIALPFGLFLIIPGVAYTVERSYALFYNFKYGIFTLDENKISTSNETVIAKAIIENHPEAINHMSPKIRKNISEECSI